MSWAAFETEFKRILQINKTPEDKLQGLDSLGVTETCVLCEEILGVSLDFREIRPLQTSEQLKALIASKGGSVV